MAEGNNLKISYNRKATNAAATSALQVLNWNSETFTATKGTAQDETVRSDGNKKGLIVTDFSGSGGFASEFGYDWSDDIYEAALRSVFESQDTITATTISTTAGTPATISDSANGLDVFEVGDIIWMTGHASATLTGAFYVVTSSAAALTVTPLDSSVTMATEAASASVTISTSRMMNANANNYFDFERAFTDVSSTFHAYFNLQVDTLNIEFGAASKVTFGVTFVGDDHTAPTATIGSSYVDASTTDALDTKNHYIGSLIGYDGGALAQAGSCVTKLSFAISNTARRTPCLGSDASLGKGAFTVSGSVDMLFNGNTHYDKFISHGEVALAAAIANSSGFGYGFYWPNARFTSADVNVSGMDLDVPQTFAFTAGLKTIGSDTFTMKMCKLGQ